MSATDATVVVGIDGSPGARAALGFAVEEARLRGARLVAVSAWSIPIGAGAPGGLIPALGMDFEADVTALLDEELAAVDTGGVEVERRVSSGPPARALVEAAESADLLVVGSRGRGGFAGLLLGSVSQQCAHHALCPVAIVPHARA